MNDPVSPLGAPSLDQLTGLVFELAAQLHVERAHRLALEAALEQAGVLAPQTCEHLAATPAVHANTAQALEAAMAGLMRVLSEDVDPRTPLRAETARPAPRPRPAEDGTPP